MKDSHQSSYQPSVDQRNSQQTQHSTFLNERGEEETEEESQTKKNAAAIFNEEQRYRTTKIRALTTFHRKLNSFIKEFRKEKVPWGLGRVAQNENAQKFMSVILKDAMGINNFMEICKIGQIPMFCDPKTFIPQSDFGPTLLYPNTEDLDKTISQRDEEMIAWYNIPFIYQVRPNSISWWMICE